MTEPTAESSSSLMAEMLRSVTHACARRPKTALVFLALSVVACLGYSWHSLKFKTDRADLIDPSAAFHQRWLRYTQSFGNSADIVVVVEADRPETIKHTLDELGPRLLKQPELYANVLYKIEPGNLRSKGLQYLAPEQLVAGLTRLEDYRPILNGRWDLIRLESLIPLLRFQLQDLEGRTTPESAGLLEHADRLAESLARFAADREDFINPWPDIVPVDPRMRDQGNQTVYLLNEAGTMGFLMAAPADKGDGFEGASRAIDRLRQLIAETTAKIPGTRISLTGIPVLENDEMRRSQSDSIRASLLSFIGVSLLFFIGMRGFVHPLLGMIVLAVGMAWSYGFTTATVGHLNILSVAFASIVIGLGNDFAIHVLSRYLDLRHHGRDVGHALVEASTSIGPGIITGAVTTALGFFCAALTTFLGVAELGIIAGGGILLCTLATFTCLPALVALADRRRAERALPVPFQGKLLRTATSRYPGLVLTLSLAFLAALGWGACDWSQGLPRPLVKYDHNLLHLQADGLESVETQKRVFDSSQNSLLYAISLADSAEEARRMKAQFEALPTVHHVEELASRLPAASSRETKLLVQAFHALLSRLPDKPDEPAPATPAQVGKMLDQFHSYLKTRSEPAAQRVAQNLDRFLEALDAMSIREQMTVLAEFQYRLGYALLAQFQALEAASDPDPVTVDDLPAALRSRFVSAQGKWLLQVYPKDQVWDMEPLARFVKDVRAVDPDVTGTPLQNFEAALQIKQSYEICAIYALIVILLVLLVDFLPKERAWQTFLPPAAVVGVLWAVLKLQGLPASPLILAPVYAVGALLVGAYWDRRAILDTLIALSAPVIGLLVTFGFLAVLDIPLNPANLIILPLVIGIGVDNGVHVLHDYHSKPFEVYQPSASLVNAITMTTSTSIVGFGSMMISAHRGLYSLGAVLSLGVASCVFLALVVLPAALAWVSRHRRPPAALPAAAPEPVDEAPDVLPISAARVA